MIRMRNIKYTMRLYEKDPLELNNLIDDSSYSDVYREMKERLLYHYMATSDFVPNRREKK